jgi:hypothetical protein
MAAPDSFYLPLSPTTHIHASGPIFLLSGDGSGAGLPAFAQQLLKQHRRRVRRVRLQTVLLAALVCVSLLSFLEPHARRGLQEVLLRARGSMRGPPPARGLDFPVQSCCIGQQCVRNSRGRHAVVTHVRSQREVTQLQVSERPDGRRAGARSAGAGWVGGFAVVILLRKQMRHPILPSRPPSPLLPPQQLAASLRRSNPSVDLAVMLVRGELGAGATQRIMDMGLTIFYVEPLRQYGGAVQQGCAGRGCQQGSVAVCLQPSKWC